MAIKEQSIHQKQSLGLKITEDRLKLLNGIDVKEIIQIIDKIDPLGNPMGTRVEILLPAA